jgi:drug/metabolite transporter (DMT)-like permease
MAVPPPRRTAALTAAAMVAFAANSLLCRAALVAPRIDAVSFTIVRVASGAAALALLVRARGGASSAGERRTTARAGSWPSALALFGYAFGFSLAYTRIPAGIGALLLFGAVQATMIGYALARGGRLRPGEWLGAGLAGLGLVVLTRPGLTAPDAPGALLMVLAGVAWGIYTLRGRGQDDPLGVTTGNFTRAALPAAASALLLLDVAPHWSWSGVLLAATSGVVASGLGYAIWYAALPGLTPTAAAIVQLSAPLLAAAGGVVLLEETLTLRLGIATPLVLGGIALAILVRSRAT